MHVRSRHSISQANFTERRFASAFLKTGTARCSSSRTAIATKPIIQAKSTIATPTSRPTPHSKLRCSHKASHSPAPRSKTTVGPSETAFRTQRISQSTSAPTLPNPIARSFGPLQSARSALSRAWNNLTGSLTARSACALSARELPAYGTTVFLPISLTTSCLEFHQRGALSAKSETTSTLKLKSSLNSDPNSPTRQTFQRLNSFDSSPELRAAASRRLHHQLFIPVGC